MFRRNRFCRLTRLSPTLLAAALAKLIQCTFAILGVSWAMAAGSTVVEVNVSDKRMRAVEGVVVSLHGDGVPAPEPMSIVLTQEELIFAPQKLVVTTGSTVSFINKDDITHHVYSFSKTWRKQFRLKRNDSQDHIMENAGKVVLGCNIHDWMLGYIYVMDTSFFGATDDTGRLQFSGVPPGEYKVRAQHPRFKEGKGMLEQTLFVSDELGSSATPVRVDFQLKKRLLPQRNQIPDLDDYP